VEVKVYRVKGRMRLSDEWRKFVIEMTSLKPEHVLEEVYSQLGSRHKLRRRHIKIEEIREIKPEDVERDHIRKLLSLDKIVYYYKR